MAQPKLDSIAAQAVELAREAAVEQGGVDAVGEHVSAVAEPGDRLVTHSFECLLPEYRDWHWAVTVVRASRAKHATVNEVVLLPSEKALLAPAWVPWEDRVGPGDIAPGMLMATPDNDPRLEPGFAASDQLDEGHDWVQLRSTVAELGLGRERVLSQYGRDAATTRWLKGAPGPHDEASQQAPATCSTCAYFVPLRGALGTQFGACSNEYSPSDAHVVSLEHGCGGHSDVVARQRAKELPQPVFDTISIDETLFD